MKKYILMALLILTSNSAMAKWIPYSETERVTGYYDSFGMVRKGNIVSIWTLTDHKNPKNVDGKEYSSAKTKVEFDCKENKERNMEFYYYSGNMGNGEVIFSGTFESFGWEDGHPGFNPMWSACKTK